MINPTPQDLGRRVKLSRWPGMVGKLVDERSCGKCRGPCCLVHYEGEKWPVASDPMLLDWADEDLL